MSYRFTSTLGLLATLTISLLIGCGGKDQAKDGKDDGHDHDGQSHHAAEGPHGGHLIELGHDHSFHAELVDDHDAGLISVYILDGDMKERPISASSITLVVTVEGKSESHELIAFEPADGKAVRFDSAAEALHVGLDEHKGAVVKLRVTIDGRPYTGTLTHEDHDDDHADHDH